MALKCVILFRRSFPAALRLKGRFGQFRNQIGDAKVLSVRAKRLIIYFKIMVMRKSPAEESGELLWR